MLLAYAPDDNTEATKIIRGMLPKLHCLIDDVKAFKDEVTLENELTEIGAKDKYLCGVVFDETGTDATSYKIRDVLCSCFF